MVNRRSFLRSLVSLDVGSGAVTRRPTPSRLNGTRLYLARHGQTEWNREGRLQGNSDIPLNEAGREQAAALARKLEGIALDAVYASTLRRSAETAAIVHGSAPLHLVTGLRERRLGAFEGRPSDAAYVQRSLDPDDDLNGGESLTMFFTRVSTALANIVDRHRSGAVLVVGHGGTNQMIVSALFRLPLARAVAFTQANDDLYLCEIVDRVGRRFWKLVDPPKA